MVPLGFELDLSPAESVALLAVLAALGLAAAQPGAVPIGLVAAARARARGRRGRSTGLVCWLTATLLVLGLVLLLLWAGLDWYAVPLAWLPAWSLALFLRPRQRPEEQARSVSRR